MAKTAATTNATQIYLSKRNKIMLPVVGPPQDSTALAATFNKNLETLGFTLSKEAFDRLKTYPADAIESTYKDVVAVLKKMVGAHRQHKPMYVNFPEQVMEMDEVELYINALIHYWFAAADLLVMPVYEKLPRPNLEEPGTIKIIELGSSRDFTSIFTSLVGANSSMSDDDKLIVRWFVDNHAVSIDQIMPDTVPQKESLALVLGYLLEGATEIPAGVSRNLKTATDVLRVMTVMSGGDVSLAYPIKTKFKNFNKKTRRFFLQALENIGYKYTTEDMLRRSEVWKRVGERLHPGDYRIRYPKTFESFDVIRKDAPFPTFNSRVESQLKSNTPLAAMMTLRERPGEFARRLDHILRISDDATRMEIMRNFLEVAHLISTPVLTQVYAHFKGRSNPLELRSFFPKGNVGKMQVIPNILPWIPVEILNLAVEGAAAALVSRFSKLPSLGKVYIDDSLANHPLPFARRSASKSLRTLSRGAKVSLPDASIIRFFLWWKDGDSRTDIDLSCMLFNEHWERTVDVSYYNLRDINFGIVHSGDITAAPNGASEYIDIDVNKVVKMGSRYVIMVLNSFTNQPYCDLPECFAGWMGRQAAKSGEVYEPKTVIDKVDLAADTTIAVPVILDLVDRKVIWADLALKNRGFLNNAASNRDNLTILGKSISRLSKMTLYDLFFLHTEARGILVDTKEEADLICSEHEGITPYDSDKILAEFLA